MCFRDAFWKGFGVVLGLFWVTVWCQNDDQKEKGTISGNVILLFSGVAGFHLGCQKERKTECESDPDSNSVL